MRHGGKVVCGGRATAAVLARGESEMTDSGVLHVESQEDSAEALRISSTDFSTDLATAKI